MHQKRVRDELLQILFESFGRMKMHWGHHQNVTSSKNFSGSVLLECFSTM